MRCSSMLAFLAMCAVLSACGKSGAAADKELTATILLPGDGETLVNPETDPDIQISGSSSGSTTPANPGDTFQVSLGFSTPNANVVGAGIRFGANGPVRTVPIGGAAGATDGTLQFDFQIPPEICDNLSNICHDIKCYEFAVTSEGKVSQANINDIAMKCGNCDEPSCQDLLEDCSLVSPECQDIIDDVVSTYGSFGAGACIDRCTDDIFDCMASNNCDASPCTDSFISCATSCSFSF